MHPAAVARAASGCVDGVVVCDHNAADNVAAVARAAHAAGLVAVPGMEITSEEEVHVVALLPDAAAAGVLHARVAAALPGSGGHPAFGEQVIADEHAVVTGFNPSALAGATTWSLERTVDEIHRAGGFAVAAHADRERFGIIGQLGFVPPGLALDAVEVSPRTGYDEGRRRFGLPLGLPVLTGSDAHTPSAIGQAVTFMRLDHVSGSEIGLALHAEQGRLVLGGGRPMEDLAMHVLDVAMNGIEAGARWIAVDITEDAGSDRLTIRVFDNGRGMDDDVRRRATDPFFTTRTTRRVGLGLPLLRQAAEAADGALEVRSNPGEGSEVIATFRHSHVDRAPLGDVETMVMVLSAARPDVDVEFTHRVGPHAYTVATADVRAALDGGTVTSPDGLALVRAAVRAGEARLAGGIVPPLDVPGVTAPELRRTRT